MRSMSLLLLPLLALAGCFSRVAYPDNSTCTNYKPFCGNQTCSIDAHGCESCTCQPAPFTRETYSPEDHGPTRP